MIGSHRSSHQGHSRSRSRHRHQPQARRRRGPQGQVPGSEGQEVVKNIQEREANLQSSSFLCDVLRQTVLISFSSPLLYPTHPPAPIHQSRLSRQVGENVNARRPPQPNLVPGKCTQTEKMSDNHHRRCTFDIYFPDSVIDQPRPDSGTCSS